jgi:hypothetical protein
MAALIVSAWRPVLKKLFALLSLLFLSACSRNESQPVEPTPLPVAANAEAQVADEDPVPRYPDAKITFSMGTEDGVMFGLETTDAREKVIAFYQDYFKGKQRVKIQESQRGLFFEQASLITSGPSATVLIKPAVNGATPIAIYSRR